MRYKPVSTALKGFLVLVAAVAATTACRKDDTRDSLTDASRGQATLIATSNGRGYDGMVVSVGQYLNLPNIQAVGAIAFPSSPPPLAVDFSHAGQTGPYLIEDMSGSGTPITTVDLERASYNLDVVGYGAGIFERQMTSSGTQRDVTNADTSNYVESWCRWQGTSTYGIDVLVNVSQVGTPEYSARIIVADGSQFGATASIPTIHEVASFPVSSENNAVIRSYEASAFSLKIKWVEPAEGGTKFEADWTATINGEDYSKPMLCRSVLPRS